MKLTGAEIIVETLLEQECDTVFGYPGGQVLNIYDALYMASDRIHHVLTAHEQGAAHAADGYARATGRVGVVIATSGPGATNLVTGIATAYLDSTPMVAITGNVPCDLIGRDSFQEVDIMGITIPITKHNYFVRRVEDLADTVREAFRIAKSGRPGPVLIDVPKNVQTDTCEYVRGEPARPYPMEIAPDAKLKEAADLLAAAERPFIYCGGGVVIAGAEREICRLSEMLDAPIGCSMMGLSAVPSDFPLMLGMQGMHGNFAASRSMADADVILACGARFSDRATGNKGKFSKRAKIIHIDIDPAEISKNIPVSLGIVGDIRNALTRLITITPSRKRPAWIQKVEQYRAHGKVEVDPSVLRPYAIIDRVCDKAPADTLVVTDVGQHQMWTAQRYRFHGSRTFITSGGLGTMGFGLGAAIGAAKGTGRRTVLFTGDGSFGMNLNEMVTAVSQHLPIVILIMNNGVLGMVRQWQTLFYNHHYSNTTLNRPTDFKKLGEAFGAVAFTVKDIGQLDEALSAAFSNDGPTLIDCHIDMDEMVLPMIPPGGAIDQLIVKRSDIKEV